MSRSDGLGFRALRMLPPEAAWSAVSGVAWAGIAVCLGHRPFGSLILGGVLAAPFIGLLIGRLSRPLHGKPRPIQIAGALVDLYLAASCFAVGMALFSHAVGLYHGPWRAALIELVWSVLWGLTFGGYVLVLWPLSYFNHRIVWRAASGSCPAAPQIRTTVAAVRRLAIGLMSLAVVGYGVWALFRVGLETWGSSASPMPWWAVTGLMGWSSWFVLGWLVWLLAPLLARGATCAAGSAEPLTRTYMQLAGLTGFVVIVLPVLSFTATMAVIVIKVALVQSWATEGAALWRASAYDSFLRMYVPWLLVGSGMIGVCRLTADAVNRSSDL